MATQWFVAHTFANREFRAAQEIQELGHGVYLPLEPVDLPATKAKIRYFAKPLFRNYVFVSFVLDEDSWQPILRKSAVRTLLGLGQSLKPKPIANHFISRVQIDLEAHRSQSMPEDTQYAPGDRIRVVGGLFAANGPQAGKIESIVRCGKQERIKILLDAMGKIPLDVPRDCIEPIAIRLSA